MVGDLLVAEQAAEPGPLSTAPSGREQASTKPWWRRGAALTTTFIGLATIGFGETKVAGQTLSNWIFVAASGVVILYLLTGRERRLAPPAARRTSTPMLAGVLTLLTAGTVSSFWSLDPFGSMAIVLRLGWLTFVWFWLLRAVAVDRDAVGVLITGLKLAVLISACAGIAGQLGLVHFTAPSGADFGSRQIGFYGHPNHLAGLLSLGLMFFVRDTRVSETPKKPQRIARILALGIVAWGLATTGSMSNTLGVIAGCLTVAMVLRLAKAPRRRRREDPLLVMVALVFVVFGLGILVTSNSPVVDRFVSWRSGDTGTNASVSSRGNFTAFVIDHLDERLLIGVGLDSKSSEFDETAIETGAAGHNMPLRLVYQAGLPALIGLLIILLVSLRQGWP